MKQIGNKDTIIGGRHVPVSGTEALRARRALTILPNEIHTTSDQRRIFMENVLLGGGVLHRGVANETEMLALNTSAPRGCWPMDLCERADTGSVWLCVENRGALLSDWRNLGGSYTLPVASPGTLGGVRVGSGLAIDGSGVLSVTGGGGGGGGGGTDAQGWTTEEVVNVTSALPSVVFPASSNFDVAKEYRIEFNRWDINSGDEVLLRVDVGGGLITSSSYERAAQYQVSGGGLTSVSFGASSTSIVAIAFACQAAAKAAGYVQFCPTDQNGGKCVFDVESRYRSSGGLATWFKGTGALSTPTTGAIQKVTLYNASANTVAVTFILKSRPLLPSI